MLNRLKMSIALVCTAGLSLAGVEPISSASGVQALRYAGQHSTKSLYPFNVGIGTGLGQEIVPLLGVKMGIFRKYGLDVTITEGATTSNVDELVGGELQAVHTGGSSAVTADAEGQTIDVVGTTLPFDNVDLYAKPSITKLSQLVGGTIGITSTTGAGYVGLLLGLKSKGYSISQFTTINIGGTAANAAAALFAGKYDAASVPLGAGQIQARELGFHELFAPALKEADDTDCIEMLSSFVSAHPQIVQDYVDGYIKSVAYMESHHNQAVKELESYEGIGLEEARYTLGVTLPLVPLYPLPSVTQFTFPDSLLATTNPAINNVSVNTIINASFVKKAKNQGIGK